MMENQGTLAAKGKKVPTFGGPELGDGVDESLVEVSRPSEAAAWGPPSGPVSGCGSPPMESKLRVGGSTQKTRSKQLHTLSSSEREREREREGEKGRRERRGL